MDMIQDWMIINKIKMGDPDAWDILVHKYYDSVYFYCVRRCYGDCDIASDLTQDIFLKSDIEYIADEIIILKKGRIENTGTIRYLLKDINKCVWECLVPEKEVNRIEQVYTVSNRKYGEDGVVLRLISREKPFANAKQVDPVLEDLYLFYFREGE